MKLAIKLFTIKIAILICLPAYALEPKYWSWHWNDQGELYNIIIAPNNQKADLLDTDAETGGSTDILGSKAQDVFNPSLLSSIEDQNPYKVNGHYRMYYAPHTHTRIYMAKSTNLKDGWSEWGQVKLIGGSYGQAYSAPDVLWMNNERKYYMWAHGGKNKKTETFESTDGKNFKKIKDAITDDAVNTNNSNYHIRNATYTRVYKHTIKRKGASYDYIMFYSAYCTLNKKRYLWLAYSNNAKDWVQEKTPFLSPQSNEYDRLFSPSFISVNTQNYLFFQDDLSNVLKENGECYSYSPSGGCKNGGKIKYVEIDDNLENPGERNILFSPPENETYRKRYFGAVFYKIRDKIYMFSGSGKMNNEFMVMTKATVE